MRTNGAKPGGGPPTRRTSRSVDRGHAAGGIVIVSACFFLFGLVSSPTRSGSDRGSSTPDTAAVAASVDDSPYRTPQLTPATPSPSARPTEAAPPAAVPTPATGTLAFTFPTMTLEPRDLAPGTRAYEGGRLPSLTITADMTRDGVALKRFNGVLYDHPVRQAYTALFMTDAYRRTGDAAYLRRAEANAERLLARARRVGSALFFPYPNDFAIHANSSQVMRAPWYSAMAQGQALSAFVRLFQVTGDQRWRDAADGAFASLTIRGPRVRPWVVELDSSGYLWLEEYPYGPHPDRTFNGHLFAVLGLYDYWELTRDANALLLMNGALATVRHYASDWRLPGGLSRYCMGHVVRSTKYHLVHTDLAYRIYEISADAWWARLGDGFIADYPDPGIHGDVDLAATTLTGYRFDGSGRVIARRTVTLGRPTHAYATSRVKVRGRAGVYLRISEGAFAGYLVREQPGIAYVQGIVYRVGWEPERAVSLAAGGYTAYAYARTGAVSRSVAQRITAATTVHAAERAVIRGMLHYRIVDGPWAGLWLPAGPGISID